MILALQQPLSLAKLAKALGEMANQKSPRLDSIAMGLYKCMWPTFGGEYLQML
jgi:hypothetical protein